METDLQTDRIILFDGVCNLCNASIRFVIDHDPRALFRFVTLQGVHGQELMRKFGLDTGDMNSFILIKEGRAYTRSTAALMVAKELKGMIKLLYGFIIVPRFIRDAVYKIIARNRYHWFGKKDSCMTPSPENLSRFLN